MPTTRLTRPNQTWALALESAFADPANPTTTELNDRRFVHLISCALTEDGTELTKGDSETDSTLTFCSIGNETTPTFANFTVNLQWLMDANTGGSGSTVDLTSLFNKVTAMLGAEDIPYWVISRTGPDASQDIDFAVEQVIKMVKVTTDVPQLVLSSGAPIMGLQNTIFTGDYNYNYHIAA